MTKQSFSIVAAVLVFCISIVASAHHGWRWTSDTDVEVSGVIESVSLGNPHGVLIINVNGEKWTAEVGQPWRNQRAGLTEEMMAVGNDIKVEGQRSTNPYERVVKAESVVVNGKRHILYPDRVN